MIIRASVAAVFSVGPDTFHAGVSCPVSTRRPNRPVCCLCINLDSLAIPMQMAPSMVIIPLTKYNAKAPTPAITNIRAYNPKNITINSILILSLVQIYEKYPKVANF